MMLLVPDEIIFNTEKAEKIKDIMESTYRLILYSRSHLADDLLNAYIDQISSFQELLSIKNAQMEAQTEEEAIEYELALKKSVSFVVNEIKHQINFRTEIQLFQLFRLISPEAHSNHPNKYRQRLVQIGKYLCPDPFRLTGLVSELFYQMTKIKNPLMKALYFHHELVRIHPFSDGNGRTIRMAKNWMLMYELYPPIFISDKAEKLEYVRTLENSFLLLTRKEGKWNSWTEAFFDQELNRLLNNASAIYNRVLAAGNLREA